MTDWQLRPGGLYVPPGAVDGPYLVRKDGLRFTEWLRLVDGTNTTVVTDDDAGTIQVDSSGGGGGGGASTPHVDTDTATAASDLVMTLTEEPLDVDALEVFWRGVALEPGEYSYVGTALTVLDQGWLTGDAIWAVYWSQSPTAVVPDPTTTLGDLLVRDATALDRFGVSGNDGYVLTEDSGDPQGMTWAAPASAAVWDNPVSLPLSTLTGWTAGTGTWAIVSGVINQALTTAGSRRLFYNTRVRQAELIMEVDIKVNSAASSTASTAGVIIEAPSTDAAGAAVIAVSTNGSTAQVNDMVAAQNDVALWAQVALAAAITNGTWFTLRVHKVGQDYEVFIDGTLLHTFKGSLPVGVGYRIGLFANATNVDFRNLDVWTPTLP